MNLLNHKRGNLTQNGVNKISHTNPFWVHPEDIGKLNLKNGELARVTKDIGYFVVRVWETDGIHLESGTADPAGRVGTPYSVGRCRPGGVSFARGHVPFSRRQQRCFQHEAEAVLRADLAGWPSCLGLELAERRGLREAGSGIRLSSRR